MGNRSSSSSSASIRGGRAPGGGGSSNCLRIAVVGLTETGKSHFVSRVTEGIENAETQSPTCGTYDAELTYGRKRIRLTELGASVGPTWQHMFGMTDFDCILWFIDSHDTTEDIYAARNMMMQATQDVHCPLCIVHNTGRPHAVRRQIASKVSVGRRNYANDGGSGGGGGISRTLYEWKDTQICPADECECKPVPVRWKHLRQVAGLEYLSSLYRRVHAVRLNYVNADAVTILLDWVIAAAAATAADG